MKVYFVGLSKVPYANRACDIRLDSFANLFNKCGYDVIILNRYSHLVHSHVSSISYTIVELIKSRNSNNRFLFLLLFALSIVKEFFYLIKERIRNKEKTILHVYSGHYFDMLFYWIISRLCGYKVIYQYVEYRIDIKNAGPYHAINGYLVDKWGAKLWDGVIPITHFLKDRALEQNKKLKWIIIPPICDFKAFATKQMNKDDIVLYCGSAAYMEVIKMVIDSFIASQLSSNFKLVLIIAGTTEKIQEIKQYAPFAIVKTDLLYSELVMEYNKAKILMIPLRNTIKDISRFPNKICEYAASRGVILTTKYGEPAYFFTDKESAVMADDYSVDSLKDNLNWLASNTHYMDKIGCMGYEVGLKSFDLSCYISSMEEYLSSL